MMRTDRTHKALKILAIMAAYALLVYIFFSFACCGYIDLGFLFADSPGLTDKWVTKLFASMGVVALLFFLGYVVLYSKIDRLNIVKKLYSYKAYLIFALIATICFSLVMPIFNIPDESTHINILFQEYGLNYKIEEICGNYIGFQGLIKSQDTKVDLLSYLDFNICAPISLDGLSLSLGCIKHLPQAIVFLPLMALGAPVIVCFTLGEIAAAVFYCVVTYHALKMMPYKKPVFAAIMLLPICIQQAGSFSYDAVLLPLCFLFIAYIFNLKFVKEQIKVRNFCVLIALTVLILIIKPPYAALFLLIFILPYNKIKQGFPKFFNLSFKIRFFIISGLAICLCALAVIFVIKFYEVILANEFVKMLAACFFHPKTAAGLFYRTIFGNGCMYLNWWISTSFGGSFGYFNVASSCLFNFWVIGCVILFCFWPEKNNYKLNVKDIIILLVTAAIIVFAIILSMMDHVIVLNCLDSATLTVTSMAELMHRTPAILGVQGRYFVPVYTLIFICISSKWLTRRIRKINYKFFFEYYLLSSFIYIVVINVLHYWI